VTECDFAADVSTFSAMDVSAPSLLLPTTSPEENREGILAARDQHVSQVVADEGVDESATDELNELVRVNAALKTVQILGQIVKSFPGSTLGSRKREIIGECYKLGLRATNALLSLLSDNKERLAADLAVHLREKGVSEREIGGKASRTIYWLGEAWALIFVIKTSEAVGLNDLWQTYDEVLRSNPSLGVSLIDLTVRLEHSRSFPENALEALITRTGHTAFTRGVLARLAYRHFYLYETDYRIKARLAAKLKIRSKPVEPPRDRLLRKK
jgi:hypothetical protein